jgi:glycosyltransferase involved in cell wall biosynthesis
MTELPPPDPRLRAGVVVPARDEEDLIIGCLRALAGQRGIEPAAYEVIVVADACTDATLELAIQAAADLRPMRVLICQ